MVRLHVQRGGESQFLPEAPGSTRLADLAPLAARIHNGRLKVQRLCSEMEELAEHGISLPYNMQGLTDEQIKELKLKDEWAEKCVPSGGSIFRKDEMGRRNGFAPNEKMQQVIKKTTEETKALISKKQVQANVCVTVEMVKDALEQLQGAVIIVYPMTLPPHDPIRLELEDQDNLSGAHAGIEVVKESEAQLWWAGKQLEETTLLSDYIGKTEKTTIIVKIQRKGRGALGREPGISHEEQKEMMLDYCKSSCPPASAYCQSLAARIARQEETNGKLHPEQNKVYSSPELEPKSQRLHSRSHAENWGGCLCFLTRLDRSSSNG